MEAHGQEGKYTRFFAFFLRFYFDVPQRRAKLFDARRKTPPLRHSRGTSSLPCLGFFDTTGGACLLGILLCWAIVGSPFK